MGSVVHAAVPRTKNREFILGSITSGLYVENHEALATKMKLETVKW